MYFPLNREKPLGHRRLIKKKEKRTSNKDHRPRIASGSEEKNSWLRKL